MGFVNQQTSVGYPSYVPIKSYVMLVTVGFPKIVPIYIFFKIHYIPIYIVFICNIHIYGTILAKPSYVPMKIPVLPPASRSGAIRQAALAIGLATKNATVF